MDISLLFAFGSNIAFATAGFYYSIYTRRTSAFSFNALKAFVAFSCFLLVLLLSPVSFQFDFPQEIFGYLSLSGLLGLCIGDIFLLKAMATLGSGRVLLLFGFQPLLIGIYSFFFLGQDFSLGRAVAVLLLILCTLSFSLESLKQKGHWESKGLCFAFLGIVLDMLGLLLTRESFERAPDLSPFVANTIRTAAACAGFLLWIGFERSRKVELKTALGSLSKAEWRGALLTCFVGTFISLSLYLYAVKLGHLATISAIAGTSPLFATLIESFLGRRPFSRYLLISVCCFSVALLIILWTPS